MTIHTSFRQGTKIIVHFKDGTILVDRFVKTNSKGFITREAGRVLAKDIRSATIWRGEHRDVS